MASRERDDYYEFRCRHVDGSEKVYRLAHTEYTWPDLFEEFRTFLRGCGYVIPEGEIEVVGEEEPADD